MHDVIIIGAGPAGLTAALYAGRFRLSTMVFERLSAGGQIILSPTIENYPGFPQGIATFDLIEKFKTQVEEVGVTMSSGEVMRFEPIVIGKQPCFTVVTEDASFESKSVIIAAGANPRRLGVKGEDALIGRGVSYCATCDAPLFKNKEVVIVGGGDRAIEEAIFLSGYCKKVMVVHRRAALRASKILEEKARAIATIEFVLEYVVEEVIGNQKVEAVALRKVSTGSVMRRDCDGVFICVGIEPNTGFIKNLLHLDAHGFIITDQTMQTSLSGVFACGDCRQKSLYQVVSACSDGAIAADSAHKYLLNL
ncbi:MAG: thioredoxin-disulfide reductase [Candidatus Omnitrophica bacterium]|nr:thioredoxin-disulfide reductase [Candidatus Omnitrophota bacterium]